MSQADLINTVITGIAGKLDEAFQEQIPIYTEPVPQGFEEPCFFIRTLNPSTTRIVGPRYQVVIPVDVHYFPDPERSNTEIQNMAFSLYDFLEFVPMGDDLVMGRGMTHETIDGVLHFFVRYSLFLLKQPTPLDPMDTIEVSPGLAE